MNSFKALPLAPVDVNYLTSRNRYEQLTTNKEALSIVGATGAAGSVAPYVYTFGDGKVKLGGSFVPSGSPTVDMAFATLPNWCQPSTDQYYAVTAIRAGLPVTNYVKVNTTGDSVVSIAVTAPGSYATLPTVAIASPGSGAILITHMKAVSATPSAAGTGYAPTQTITLTGSTGTNPILTITSTKVVSATIAAAGTGGTPGPQTVTGTTGTGTKFQASVTVSGGGAITAVLSITVAGVYTVNPTSISAEPVTGASLTGAQLDVVMGVNVVTPSTPGDCTVLAASPVAQGSTSGSGTGATFTVLWGLLSVAVTHGGSGYTTSSAVTISGGGGTGGGTATITLDTVHNLQLLLAATASDIVYLDAIEFLVNSYISQ